MKINVLTISAICLVSCSPINSKRIELIQSGDRNQFRFAFLEDDWSGTDLSSLVVVLKAYREMNGTKVEMRGGKSNWIDIDDGMALCLSFNQSYKSDVWIEIEVYDQSGTILAKKDWQVGP